MPYNFIAKFQEYSDKAKEIRNAIENCLMMGSGTADDPIDIVTCASILSLTKEVQGVENYKIAPREGDKDYLILFDIEDNSFKSPYHNEKMLVRFGIRFMDTFLPPATEVAGIQEKEGEKYLEWGKNFASDVRTYKIYARSLGPYNDEGNEVDENNLIKEIGQKDNEVVTKWKIEYDSDEKCKEKEKLGKTCLKKGESYYFYIIAVDNAGNTAAEMWPEGKEPQKLSI